MHMMNEFDEQQYHTDWETGEMPGGTMPSPLESHKYKVKAVKNFSMNPSNTPVIDDDVWVDDQEELAPARIAAKLHLPGMSPISIPTDETDVWTEDGIANISFDSSLLSPEQKDLIPDAAETPELTEKDLKKQHGKPGIFRAVIDRKAGVVIASTSVFGLGALFLHEYKRHHKI